MDIPTQGQAYAWALALDRFPVGDTATAIGLPHRPCPHRPQHQGDMQEAAHTCMHSAGKA